MHPILGWLKRDSDELRLDLASNSGRDLIHPSKKLDNNFHVSFPLAVLRRELHTQLDIFKLIYLKKE